MYCVCLTVSHDPLHFIQCILLHQCTSLISVMFYRRNYEFTPSILLNSALMQSFQPACPNEMIHAV
jgi:hypothetical protein